MFTQDIVGGPSRRARNPVGKDRAMTKKSQTISFEASKEYTLDEFGYLDPPDQWDRPFAEGMAKTLGVFGGLTDEHWSFIRYLREKFEKEKTVPLLVFACLDNGLRLNRLKYLFPTGYHRGACKIAGINYAFIVRESFLHTMESYSTLETDLGIDDLGFLKDFRRWDERFVHVVADEWDLPDGLTEKHWQVIRYLRDHYTATGNVPTVFETCKANELGLAELRRLFPAGYRRGACRAAGLPFVV